jgi:hypothetical protein
MVGMQARMQARRAPAHGEASLTEVTGSCCAAARVVPREAPYQPPPAWAAAARAGIVVHCNMWTALLSGCGGVVIEACQKCLHIMRERVCKRARRALDRELRMCPANACRPHAQAHGMVFVLRASLRMRRPPAPTGRGARRWETSRSSAARQARCSRRRLAAAGRWPPPMRAAGRAPGTRSPWRAL